MVPADDSYHGDVGFDAQRQIDTGSYSNSELDRAAYEEPEH